jgi:hypothetical protein
MSVDKIMSEETAYKEIAQNYYLSAKEVSQVLNVSIATANRRIKEVKMANNSKKYEKITLFALCNYFDLSPKYMLLKF